MKFILQLKSLWLKWFGSKEDTQTTPELPKEFRKLSGFPYIEIISEWVKVKFPFQHVIILTNINVQVKTIKFWAKVPTSQVMEFLNDVVVMRCKDQTSMEELVTNIGFDFAEAYGYSGGKLILTNKESL